MKKAYPLTRPVAVWSLLAVGSSLVMSACGQNPALKISDPKNSNSSVSASPASSLTANEAAAAAAVQNLLAEAGPNAFFSDVAAEPLSEKDQADVGKDVPFLNNDQDDRATRPIHYPPQMTTKGRGYAKRSNIVFRLSTTLPPREAVKKITEAKLILKVRKYIPSNQTGGQEPRTVGPEILCLLDAKTCSGKLDNETANHNRAFLGQHPITGEDFSKIALPHLFGATKEGAELRDSDQIEIPLEKFAGNGDLMALLYEKSAPTNDPSIRKLRFVMGDRVFPLIANLKLRFELDPDKMKEQLTKDAAAPAAAVDRHDEPIGPVEKICPTFEQIAPPTPKAAPEVRVNLDARFVRFATNSDKLDADSQAKVDALAAILKSVEFDGIEVSGHTDTVGNAQYNKALSLKRAETVKKALIKAGIKTAKIKTMGYGPDRPLDLAKTPAAYSKNRRVELRLQGVADAAKAELKKQIEQAWPGDVLN